MDEEVLGIIGAVLIVLLPVMAISARIAINPIVDAIARLRESFATDPATDVRVARLEEEVERLRADVRHLRDVESFDARLQGPRQESGGSPVPRS